MRRFACNQTSHFNSQRVLIALYVTGDDDSLVSTATNAEIAKASGLSAETAKQHISTLRYQGDIAVFKVSDFYVKKRTIVFLDHPAAGAKVAEFDALARPCEIERREWQRANDEARQAYCEEVLALERKYQQQAEEHWASAQSA